MFWAAPAPDLTVVEWLMTWVAYALASACALSAVSWSGLGGWRGLFLGGALLGFVVEGVIASTMYDGFPFQLVWTPLAWHALLTALALGGLGRVGWVWPRILAGYVALGVVTGAFALFWPLERVADYGVVPVGVYLVGVGLGVPLGQWGLGRIGTAPRPPGWVLCVVPGMALALWAVQTVFAPSPVRLACPAMIGMTVWAMRRLGGGGVVSFGAPGGWPLLAMAVPVVMSGIALMGWAWVGPVAMNIPVALVTAPIALGLWLWCLWRAMRAVP
jgi:hypothetical protein